MHPSIKQPGRHRRLHPSPSAYQIRRFTAKLLTQHKQ